MVDFPIVGFLFLKGTVGQKGMMLKINDFIYKNIIFITLCLFNTIFCLHGSEKLNVCHSIKISLGFHGKQSV